MKYLKIENPGVAPHEGFTLLGASTKDSNTEWRGCKVIGTFGSGAKHALAVLLRAEINPIVFTDKLRMEFHTKSRRMEDDIQRYVYREVMVKFSGQDRTGRSKTSTKGMNFGVQYGQRDWTEIAYACREYVSNAIDHSLKYNQHHDLHNGHPWDGTVVEIVEEKSVRAKSGTTRVFVPLTDEVEKFYEDLGHWFLHFSEPDLLQKEILPKAGRSQKEDNPLAPAIYRRGVYVRTVETMLESMYDYNLEDLRMDESRTVDDYNAKSRVGKALRNAGADVLTTFLNGYNSKNSYWEHSLDHGDSWRDGYDPEEQIEQRQRHWEAAVKTVGGDNAVLVSADDSVHTQETLRRKGWNPVVMPPEVVRTARQYKVPTVATVLSQDERDGLDVLEPYGGALSAVDFIWDQLEGMSATRGKDKPEVKSFRSHQDGESEKQGFYRDNTVFINCKLTTDQTGYESLTDELLYTAIEEVAHYVTGSTDNSRDFQEFFIRLTVALMRSQTGQV